MKNQNDKTKLFKVSVITPENPPITAECDSLHITVADNEKGIGGGLYGIRKGHANAVLSLGKGKLNAMINGENVLSLTCEGGFAKVSKDSVTVITEKADEAK